MLKHKYLAVYIYFPDFCEGHFSSYLSTSLALIEPYQKKKQKNKNKNKKQRKKKTHRIF